MDRNDFAGMLAIVRPDLESHPLQKKGVVGVVLHVGADHAVYMEFADHAQAVFQPYEVFQLKEKEYLAEIKANGEEIDIQEYKDLYTIDLLQKMGRSTDLMRALETAAGNEKLWNRTLQTVESRLGIGQTYALNR